MADPREERRAVESDLLEQGMKAFDDGDYERALAVSKELIEATPGDAMAWWLRGATLMARGEHRPAVEALEKCLERNDALASAWFQKGLAHHNLAEFAEASEAYDRASGLEPENAQYQRRLGQALVQSGKFADATTPLRKALELNPEFVGDGESLALLCTAFNETGRPQDALALLEAARREEPKPSENAQLWFQEGLARNLLQDHEGALEALDRAETEIAESAQLGLLKLQVGLAR